MSWKKTKWRQDMSCSGDIDGESLPIQCACGYGKEYWGFSIGIYKDRPKACPKCGRQYYFENEITVYVKQPK